jgi:hypothetical protein
MTEKEEETDGFKGAVYGLGLCLIIGALIAWLIITLSQWMFYTNFDACYYVFNRMPYECITHPVRYTIPEILSMQWEWIIAHKVI